MHAPLTDCGPGLGMPAARRILPPPSPPFAAAAVGRCAGALTGIAVAVMAGILAAARTPGEPPRSPRPALVAPALVGTAPAAAAVSAGNGDADGRHPPRTIGAAGDREGRLAGRASVPPIGDWQRLAVNALLVPLLDLDEARFAQPTLVHPCVGQAEVAVDGRPYRGGDPLPAGPFVVSWHLEGCAPLGAGWYALTGDVELAVRPGKTALDVAVQPGQLVGRTADGAQVAIVGAVTSRVSLADARAIE